MSVPLSKRKEGELKVFTQARKFVSHTIHICSNEKVFPKRYRWCITNKIVDTSISMLQHIDLANAFRLDDPSSARLRLNYQNQALAETFALLTLMNLARDAFGVPGPKMLYWTGLLVPIQDLIRGWKRSDKTRIEKQTNKQ